MKAIVYTTNTGSTESYARLLSQETGLPAYSMAEAKTQLDRNDEIIYLGWLMANSIKGYAAPQGGISRAPCAPWVCAAPELKPTLCAKRTAYRAKRRFSRSKATST